MTKEIFDILTAYAKVRREGRKAALATVVHVEGSSYRRPGARMLIEDSGQMTGAISGGCLEGDALRKALQAISLQKNKLVTYNTLEDDDLAFGVQLGCNGIVHILFEPVLPGMAGPIDLLEALCCEKKEGVLVTLFSLKDYHGSQPGTCYYFNGTSLSGKRPHAGQEADDIISAAAAVLTGRSSDIRDYNDRLTAFFEYQPLPVSLVIIGAGNDALPLVDMTAILGWQTTVVDGRSTHANRRRFPAVHQVLVARADEVLNQIEVTERTVFVLMTHNYNYDLELLKHLLIHHCPYIGILGPRKRLQRLYGDLEEEGIPITVEQRSRIFGPTGLDIGAESAEEIALSVLAEIKAVLGYRSGTFLREKSDPIHGDPALREHLYR
ncbi:MAG TPA: XdhC family protein [Sphingobacteriaceae bacterium]